MTEKERILNYLQAKMVAQELSIESLEHRINSSNTHGEQTDLLSKQAVMMAYRKCSEEIYREIDGGCRYDESVH